MDGFKCLKLVACYTIPLSFVEFTLCIPPQLLIVCSTDIFLRFEREARRHGGGWIEFEPGSVDDVPEVMEWSFFP